MPSNGTSVAALFDKYCIQPASLIVDWPSAHSQKLHRTCQPPRLTSACCTHHSPRVAAPKHQIIILGSEVGTCAGVFLKLAKTSCSSASEIPTSPHRASISSSH